MKSACVRWSVAVVALLAASGCSGDDSSSGATGGAAGSGSAAGSGGANTGGAGAGGSGTGATGAGGAGTGATSSGGAASGGTSSGGSGGTGTGPIIFADDFESGNLSTWDDKSGEANKYRITNDASLVHSGSGALDVTIQTSWSSGQLAKWFTGVDELHVSMQIMFAAGWNQNGVTSRHLMQLSGNHVDIKKWGPFPDSSFGQAGVTPDGTDFFWIHLTPWNDNAWHVGLAHPDQSSQWGDSIQGSIDTKPGSYQHAVWHAKLNDLGSKNGFVRLTIDGNVAVERTGVEWRKTNKLVLNSFGFQAYYQSFPGTSHVYVDDLVIRQGAP